MAQITIQEILGDDNVALSRPKINSNFKVLRDGINTIEKFLNTTPVNGELSIGSITIPLGQGQVSDVKFISQTSVRIEGNLQILQELTVENVCNFNDDVIVQDNVTFERNNDTINYFKSQTRTTFEDLINIDIDDTPVTIQEAVLAPIDVKDYGTTTKQGKNVLNIDLTGDGTSTSNVIQLGQGDIGQLLIVRFLNTPTGPDTYYLDNTNFSSIYGSNLSVSGIGEVVDKSTMILSYTSNGWVVLSITGPSSLTYNI